MDDTNPSGSSYLLPAEHLPLFARIALKRLEEQPERRSAAFLDALLTELARTYGDRANRRIVDSCTWICRGLYGRDSFPMQGVEEGEGRAA
jgi:hypothetical protein